MVSKEDYKLLTNLLTMKEDTLYKFALLMLSKHYPKNRIEARAGEYIIAFGTKPVGLLAHLDTVFPIKPTEDDLFFDSNRNVLWSSCGLGADDRAGVFIISKLLKYCRAHKQELPTIIFTLGEEKGGLGASAFIADYPINHNGIKFLIELDRQGKDDSVYYDCGNKEFEEFINEFGFVTDWGTFTDISIIAPVWDVAAVNLSVGYFNEHTKTEMLFLNYLYATFEKVKKILGAATDKEFAFCKRNWYEDYLLHGADFNVICKGCEGTFSADTCIPFVTKNGGYAYICPDCLNEKFDSFSWCGFCGEMYDPAEETAGFCPKCLKKIIV